MSSQKDAAERTNAAAAKNTKSTHENSSVSRASGPVNIPRLAAAIAQIRPLGGQHNDDDEQCGCSKCRLQQEADEAIAAELLPLILGGAWSPATRQYFGSTGLFLSDLDYPLFDHRQLFRERGTRGGNTLSNCAIVSHPYGITSEALGQAARLRARGIGVWAHAGLSSWYPGWTTLVIASPRLMAMDAAAFGFKDLAGGAP